MNLDDDEDRWVASAEFVLGTLDTVDSTAFSARAARDPELASYLNAGGMPVVGSNGEQFAARMREDIEGWTPIVKAGKLSAAD